MTTMRGVVFDGEMRLEPEVPVPEARAEWALVRVRKAGICKTDMEIMKGYMGFTGILGHEFVGIVHACADESWLGQRVVGEINAACGTCDWCRRGLGRHCPNRTVLGIKGLDGCMADYCVLPVANLLPVPEDLSDDRAVLTEPLSAACEILEQVPVSGEERVVVLGDGRLGILCAWVLATALSDVTLVGRHAQKLDRARWRKLKTTEDVTSLEPGADIVVDATGSGAGVSDAMNLCRARGTLVLKSTVASQGPLNLAPVVVDELTVVGSRCGRFEDGLKIMQENPDMPLEKLITARFPLENAVEAFETARERDMLKVILELED
jgi:alcohol dehydrogenase